MDSSQVNRWIPIDEADKALKYDLVVSDGTWRERVADCFWRPGGRHGKADWWTWDGGEMVPVVFVENIMTVTHAMLVPELPSG